MLKNGNYSQTGGSKVIIIVGPTAVGKTAFSMQLAEKLKNAEIISADSRQIYRFMDIGTAKPTPQERKRVTHHFIDIKYPDEYYSAGKFGQEAREVIKQLQTQGKRAIVVGGSGLYVRALVDGFFNKQIYDQSLKAKLKKEIEEKGLASLYERLQQVDPESAQRIHPNDGHRIVRALEVYELTGIPFSEFQKEATTKADFEPVFWGLTRERDELYRIIERRVDQMLSEGLVEEVMSLKARGYSENLNSMQTVGYKEVFDFLNGKISRQEMIRLIKQHSRNYAKRQLTWFRKDQRIQWIHLSENELFDHHIEKILEQIDEP